jgi:carbamoyl-phosphate synthase large subunit
MQGFVGNEINFANLDKELSEPTDKRIFAVAVALKQGYSVDKIHDLTKITKWFLFKMKNIVDLENHIANKKLKDVDTELMRHLKQNGFSDYQIGKQTIQKNLKFMSIVNH